jgi:hypothetical protein
MEESETFPSGVFEVWMKGWSWELRGNMVVLITRKQGKAEGI